MAMGQGRGEKITRLPLRRTYFFVIVAFKKGLSTKDIYAVYDQKYQQPVSLTQVKADVKICAQFLDEGHLLEATQLFENDLDRAAREKLSQISEVLAHWKNRKVPSLLSGSGSSVFAIFKEKSEALKEARVLSKARDLRVFVVESYNQSLIA